MLNYFFVDNASGEEFIVLADCLKDAKSKAALWFKEPVYDSILSDFEAEMIGVDTYD